MDSTGSLPERLCLSCGLCCNGVIFADVRLQPGDPLERLQASGLLPLSAGKQPKTATPKPSLVKIKQPCAAFNGCCSVYKDRPSHCSEFQCALLKKVMAGASDEPLAARIITKALYRAERVRKLLRKLGDVDEHLPLSKRFRRIQKRMETQPIDEESADIFGLLTLAVLDLNHLLSQEFYPGSD